MQHPHGAHKAPCSAMAARSALMEVARFGSTSAMRARRARASGVRWRRRSVNICSSAACCCACFQPQLWVACLELVLNFLHAACTKRPTRHRGWPSWRSLSLPVVNTWQGRGIVLRLLHERNGPRCQRVSAGSRDASTSVELHLSVNALHFFGCTFSTIRRPQVVEEPCG